MNQEEFKKELRKETQQIAIWITIGGILCLIFFAIISYLIEDNWEILKFPATYTLGVGATSLFYTKFIKNRLRV